MNNTWRKIRQELLMWVVTGLVAWAAVTLVDVKILIAELSTSQTFIMEKVKGVTVRVDRLENSNISHEERIIRIESRGMGKEK